MQVRHLSSIEVEIYVFVLDLQILIKLNPIILKRKSGKGGKPAGTPDIDNSRPV